VYRTKRAKWADNQRHRDQAQGPGRHSPGRYLVRVPRPLAQSVLDEHSRAGYKLAAVLGPDDDAMYEYVFLRG
jgi:hypothetical protein